MYEYACAPRAKVAAAVLEYRKGRAMTSALNSGLEETLGRYTVWAIRGGQKEVSQRCASWAEAVALKAEWEVLGYTVQVFSSMAVSRQHRPQRRAT